MRITNRSDITAAVYGGRFIARRVMNEGREGKGGDLLVWAIVAGMLAGQCGGWAELLWERRWFTHSPGPKGKMVRGGGGWVGGKETPKVVGRYPRCWGLRKPHIMPCKHRLQNSRRPMCMCSLWLQQVHQRRAGLPYFTRT